MSETTANKFRIGLPVWLFIITVVLCICYTIYWFVMADRIKQEAQVQIAENNSAALDITYDEIKVSGFPYRFVVDVRGTEIHAPLLQARWKGPSLQFITQSYNLFHVIMKTPDPSVVMMDDGRVYEVAQSKDTAASVRFTLDTVKEFRLQVPNLQIRQADNDWLSFSDLVLGLRPMPDDDNSLQLAFSVLETALDQPLQEASWLGSDIKQLIVWAEVENFYPLVEGDLSFGDWQKAGNKIHLRRGEIDWGPLDLSGVASVSLDQALQPMGTVGLHLERAEELKAALSDAGKLTQETEIAITSLATFSQKDTPLTLEVRDRGFYLFGNKVGAY